MGAVMQREGGQKPADRRADHDEPQHPAARVAQFVDVEAEAPLEQDHRHGERDQRLQQRAEFGGRIKQAQPRADDDADRQHQHDRGQLQAPRKPLRPHPQHADQRHGRHGPERAQLFDRHACPLDTS